MPTVLESLATARENYATQLAALSNPAARKVSYSIAGRSVQWTEYQRFLTDQIAALDAQIAAADPDWDGSLVTAVR